MTLTALLAVGLVGVGVASADEDDFDHATGTGSTLVASFTFDVRTATGDPASTPSGTFDATPTPPVDALIHLAGPATCVHVVGNRVGFVYPLEDGSSPDALKGLAVMISAQDNGPGNADLFGFVGPAPAAAFPNCDPGPTPLTVDGDIVVHDAV